MQALESLNPTLVLAMALTLVAVAMLVLGVSMVRRLRGQGRSRRSSTRRWPLAADGPRRPSLRVGPPGRRGSRGGFLRQAPDGRAAGRSPDGFGRPQAGRYGGLRESGGGAVALRGARFVLAILLPIAAVALDLEKNLIDSSVGVLIAAFLGFAVGYMLPKIFVRRRLARRRRQAADELPLLIDLLRLLQGVGHRPEPAGAGQGIRPGAAGAVL